MYQIINICLLFLIGVNHEINVLRTELEFTKAIVKTSYACKWSVMIYFYINTFFKQFFIRLVHYANCVEDPLVQKPKEKRNEGTSLPPYHPLSSPQQKAGIERKEKRNIRKNIRMR